MENERQPAQHTRPAINGSFERMDAKFKIVGSETANDLDSLTLVKGKWSWQAYST